MKKKRRFRGRRGHLYSAEQSASDRSCSTPDSETTSQTSRWDSRASEKMGLKVDSRHGRYSLQFQKRKVPSSNSPPPLYDVLYEQSSDATGARDSIRPYSCSICFGLED
jgi:hypothetical protein